VGASEYFHSVVPNGPSSFTHPPERTTPTTASAVWITMGRDAPLMTRLIMDRKLLEMYRTWLNEMELKE